MGNTDAAIIDIQFVIGNGKEYCIKELAILELETSKSFNYVFKPKYHYSKLDTQAKLQNFYNYKNINGLRWKDGTWNYKEISTILNKLSNTNIIVRGIDKKQILQSYLPDAHIMDLDMNKSLECCDDPGICCILHQRSRLRCAYRNIFKIKNYIEDNKINISY